MSNSGERKRKEARHTPRDAEEKISGSEGTTKHGWLEVDQGPVLSLQSLSSTEY